MLAIKLLELMSDANIYEEKLDLHVDTPEGGHYFIFSADVVEIELDEEVLRAIQQGKNKKDEESRKGIDEIV